MPTAKARFAIQKWDEQPYCEGDGLPRLTGRHGTFVLRRTGAFVDGHVQEQYDLVKGSGTGDLQELKGSGRTSAGHGTEHPFELDYQFE